MIQAWLSDEDGRRADAADWVVRLQAPDLTEDQAVAFDAWLSASDDNARAYDAALGVMQEVEASAPRIAYDLRRLPQARPPLARSDAARRGWMVAGGLAAAATIAVAVMPIGLLSAPPQTFTTAKGEHRTVTLADGTTVDLNAGTRMTVTMARHERRVSMPQGEAVFDVAADHARPFLIAAGDRTVRVVGTRFDVRRRGGQLSVTVDRGVVEVRPNEAAPGRAFRLHPGQRLDHEDGAAVARVHAVEPSDVYAWRTGRLIYRDQPLGDVVADLNQQYARQIRLEDPAMAATRFSGVLVLDNQDAVIRRLALLAPLRALRSGDGVTLRRDEAAKP
ncbi:MAG: transcriptional regulator [Phenylobacterium sp.]|nr:transcriptional regulator [Phenylobacterium sp.]